MSGALAEKGEMIVRRIKNGIVIDHIPAGHALKVLQILKIDGSGGNIVSVAMNVGSRSMGKKDIVKIEEKFLGEEEINKISLVAPQATYNIVRDFKVVEKHHVHVPDVLENLVRCENPKCVTNQKEPVPQKAIVVSKSPVKIKCYYCGRYIYHIEKQVI